MTFAGWLQKPIEPDSLVLNWFPGGGVAAFWLERLAKLLEFLSGSVIVLEVVGKERVDAFADALEKRRIQLHERHPVLQVQAALVGLVETVNRLNFYANPAHKDIGEKALFWIRFSQRLISGVVAAVAITSQSRGPQFEQSYIWQLPVSFILVFALVYLAIHTIVVPIMVVPMFLIFRPKQRLREILIRCISLTVTLLALWKVIELLLPQLVLQWRNQDLSFLQHILNVVLIIIGLSCYVALAAFVSYTAVELVPVTVTLLWISLVMPVAWVVDNIAHVLSTVMGHTGVVRFLLALALLALIVGFGIDLSLS